MGEDVSGVKTGGREKGEVMKISVRRHLGKMTEVCFKSGPVGN